MKGIALQQLHMHYVASAAAFIDLLTKLCLIITTSSAAAEKPRVAQCAA